MPRLCYHVTVYECPLCGIRVRAKVGRTLKCGRHRNEPEDLPVEMMQTVIGPRPRPRPHQPIFEPVLVDIGPVSDPSL